MLRLVCGAASILFMALTGAAIRRDNVGHEEMLQMAYDEARKLRHVVLTMRRRRAIPRDIARRARDAANRSVLAAEKDRLGNAVYWLRVARSAMSN